MLPHIDPAIWRLRPDFAAFSLVARGVRNGPSDADSREALAQACAAAAAGPDWAEAHLAAWQAAYRAFGARPQRTPCSAEALRRRVARDGAMPAINAAVDLYNAVSIAHAVPVGGEDLDAYAGAPRLVRATGQEMFDTVKDGAPFAEPVEPGEVVWMDDLGVTCRRWNWRQGRRTRVTEASARIWFVIERLEPMPLAALRAAGAALIDGLRRRSPGMTLDATLLTMDGVAA